MRLAELRDRISFRHQIALLAGLLCVATAIVVALVAGTIARQETVATTRDSLVAIAGEMASRLDRQMFERYREIQNTAGFPPLRDIWKEDPDAVRGVLEQIQRTLPDYAWIGLASPEGQVLAATGGLLEGASVAQRPWFINGLEGPAVEDVHDAKLLSQLLTPAPDQEPFRFVDVAVPVRSADGQLAGVLGAHLSWEWAREVRAGLLADRGSSDAVEILVYAGDGTMLIGPADAGQLSGAVIAAARREGVVTVEHDGSGEDGGHLAAVVPTTGLNDYPGLGWIVLARAPEAEVLAHANRLFGIILAVGAVVAVVSSALVFLLTGLATRPLLRLTSSIDRISPGSAATVEVQHGCLEVVQLSTSLRSMLRRLGLAEAREREALHRVAEIQTRAEQEARKMGDDMVALRQLADTDPLTGLLNRRVILAEGEAAFRARPADDPLALAVLMIDIDHFKRVNDVHGHAAGDLVIATIAGVASRSTREPDHVGRVGGEEFLVLMPGVQEALAVKIAERIRETIAATPIAWGDEEVRVTVSVGATVAGGLDTGISDLIGRADGALYAAKSNGRNQTVFRAAAA